MHSLVFCYFNLGGHLGFMQIRQNAQGCPEGNQAKNDPRTNTNTIQQKNLIVPTISRFPKFRLDYYTFLFDFKDLNHIHIHVAIIKQLKNTCTHHIFV